MLEKLNEKARELGLDIFGTAKMGNNLPENLRSLPYSISIGVRLLDGIIDEVKNGATHTYFHHYRTVNTFLDQCALQIAFLLQREGYSAFCVPASQTVDSAYIAGIVSHKKAAVLAGLGFIGKNCLFISKDFGARVRLCTLLTNLPLPDGKMMESGCKQCDRCIGACECGALYGVAWEPSISRENMMDAKKCSNFMKKKYKDIGRGAVCGVCMAVCPYA
jgi:epoxyqueuosine reductase QueG